VPPSTRRGQRWLPICAIANAANPVTVSSFLGRAWHVIRQDNGPICDTAVVADLPPRALKCDPGTTTQRDPDTGPSPRRAKRPMNHRIGGTILFPRLYSDNPPRQRVPLTRASVQDLPAPMSQTTELSCHMDRNSPWIRRRWCRASVRYGRTCGERRGNPDPVRVAYPSAGGFGEGDLAGGSWCWNRKRPRTPAYGCRSDRHGPRCK
jgi:hypothetical protein